MADTFARQRQLLGTTAEWAANNLIIGNGEIAVERDGATDKMKIGDGTRTFSALPYITSQGTIDFADLGELRGGTVNNKAIAPDVLAANTSSIGGGGAAGKWIITATGGVLDKSLIGITSLADIIANTSAGATDANKLVQLDAAGKISPTMINITGGMDLKGNIDPTSAAPAAVSGDYYFAQPGGVADASFTGIAGSTINGGDVLIYDGADWHANASLADLGNYLPVAGGTLTGPLTLSGAPTADSQAATKKYVDDLIPAMPTPSVPAGSKMLFWQATAPTGWVRDTTQNDKALRVVSGGSAGGTGGAVSFSQAFKSQNVSGTVSNTTAGGSVAVNNHTLTVAQMPTHFHGPQTLLSNAVIGGSYADGTHPFGLVRTEDAGGSQPHNHGASFTGAAHGHTFSGTTIDLRVNYVDLMICTKS